MAEYVEAKTTTRIAIDPRKTMPWHDRQFIRVGAGPPAAAGR